MIIVSASDENFVPHFATMLHSAWVHNAAASFFLLDCGITDETRKTIETFANKHGIRLTILPIDTSQIADLPVGGHWTTATYARLLMPSCLPPAVEKAIYVDADCVVTDDLSALWSTDLHTDLMGGVRDEPASAAEHKNGNELDLRDYINCGVMLVNIRAWREEDFFETAIGYLRDGQPLFADQSLINAAAIGRTKTIPEYWNYMLHKRALQYEAPVVPRIIHFTGMRKPWKHRDTMFTAIYVFHRNFTPFPVEAPRTRYRSSFRTLLNLIFLRKKHWRLARLSRHYERTFTSPYLEKLAEKQG